MRDAGLIALAASTSFAHLERLNLAGNPFGDAGVVALSRSSSVAGLEEH